MLSILIGDVDKKVRAVDVTGITTQLNSALNTVNHPCKPGPCGTLAKIDQTMNVTQSLAAGGNMAINDADKVEKLELKMLPVWNRQVTTTLSNVDKTTATLNTSVKQLTAGALPVLDDTDTSVKHLDALVTAPELKDTMTHVDAATASLASSAVHVDGTTAHVEMAVTDVQVKVHHITNPEKVKLGFWGATWATLKEITSHSPPLF
jgi:hypothetical protein